MPRTSAGATPAFADLYSHPPTVRADAPGRVNLIGEHTDYNGGFVLPVALAQRTRVELAPRKDSEVHAWSAEAAPAIEKYRLGEEQPQASWLDYVQGVTRELQKAGHQIGGFELRVESDLPAGSGLSSSAALTVALLRALREAFGLEIDDVGIAKLAQKAENDFVGAPVGIMDPMAASLGDEAHALFLDTRSLQFERIALPAEAELVVIDSGISHRHAGGEYRTRREECEKAAELLGVQRLCDLGNGDLWRLGTVAEPFDRRARHVITEHARVRSAVAALRERDLPRLGSLLNASHESLQNDFEVSLPEIDLLVELIREEPDVYGARITGGGFGGSIVALARPGSGRGAGERAAARYADRTGNAGTVLVPAGRP